MSYRPFTTASKTILTAFSICLLLPLGANGQDKPKAAPACQGTLNDSKTNIVLKALLGNSPLALCTVDKAGACKIIFTAKTGSKTGPKTKKGGTKALSLTLSRLSPKTKWDIYLTAKTAITDPERLSITVDNNEPMDVSTEFLFQKADAPNSVYIDQRLTRVVVNEIQSGKTATMTLTYNKGKILTEKLDKTSFKDAQKAFEWVDCMMLMR